MIQGGILPLRSSAPTFSRVRSRQDPDADGPHGSSVDKVVWEMMLFGQREVRGRRMKKGGDPHGSPVVWVDGGEFF